MCILLLWLRLHLFWHKTILGNDFTPHRVFGCVWKIEFSGNQFHLTVNIMPLTQKMVYISIFTSNHFQRRTNRDRERERKKREYPSTGEFALPRSHHHRDCTPTPTPPSRSSPPKTDLIGADVTDLVLVLDRKLIGTADLVVSISSHQWSHRLDLVTHDPWPISPFPSIFDHSLFLPLLVWPNCGV